MENSASARPPIVPLISGAESGSLGILHLPRLWLKMRLSFAGRLPEGYRHGSGTDEILLDTFGIDAAAFARYVETELPDEQQLEAWVRAHATALSPEKCAAFNKEIGEFEMPEPRRGEWLARFGLDPAHANGIGLNQLDDWAGVHAQIIARETGENVVPAISSSIAGPLGVLHLPRLWLKHLLHAAGRLPDGYRHGLGGFDEVLTTRLEIDRDAFAAYCETELPDYLAAESWVKRNASQLDAGTVAELNAYFRSATMPEAMAAERRARFNITDPSFVTGIPLNDLDDWAGLHEQLAAAHA